MYDTTYETADFLKSLFHAEGESGGKRGGSNFLNRAPGEETWSGDPFRSAARGSERLGAQEQRGAELAQRSPLTPPVDATGVNGGREGERREAQELQQRLREGPVAPV